MTSQTDPMVSLEGDASTRSNVVPGVDLGVPTAPTATSQAGRLMVLLAAFLGWMFDGLEMGIFPQVARPAMVNLMPGASENAIGFWHGVIDALFLSGAALGGLVFGYLGDKVGRVRAMSISILVYSLFTGACYFAHSPWQIGALRFVSAIGMGGEWSLGVALVMEVWPSKARPLLAGIIGAASNVGFLVISGLCYFFPVTPETWRWVMLAGAAPAALTFVIRIFVPESERWEESQKHGPTAPLREAFTGKTAGVMWLAIIFASVALLGTWGAIQKVPAWVGNLPVSSQFGVTAKDGALIAMQGTAQNGQYTVGNVLSGSSAERAGLRAGMVVTAIDGIAVRSEADILGALVVKTDDGLLKPRKPAEVIQMQVLAGGVTSTLSMPLDRWNADPRAKAVCGMLIAVGAIIGCLIAPVMGAYLGRRVAYFLLCVVSLVLSSILFRGFDRYGFNFQVMLVVAGGVTAAFYGWLPLYLPELFPTRVRATAQGIAFNFGRIIAAAGALAGAHLVELWGDYGKMGAVISLIYVLGMVSIWFAPETKGRPLPD